MVTSDKCYQNVEQVWGYREEDAMGDYSPYGGSKGAAELAIRSYRNSFFPIPSMSQHGVRLASARAGNVIGGGDWTKDALMVDVVTALHGGEAIRLRSPKALRPWQHVLQCLSGYLTIAAKLLGNDAAKYCSGWNIGPLPGNELPVAELVAYFQTCWKSGTVMDASDPGQPPEAGILRLAIDKAIWELGWRPRWSVYTTLEKTAEWYRKYFEGVATMQSVSLRQIEEYESSLSELTSAADGESMTGLSSFTDRFLRSRVLQRRAHQMIPGGCHTYAKGDDQFPLLAPGFIDYGRGCHVWDVDGNEYIEYGMGCRAVTLGHAFPPVIEAVAEELTRGTNFTRPAAIEIACAEELLGMIQGSRDVQICQGRIDGDDGRPEARTCPDGTGSGRLLQRSSFFCGP